MSMFNFTDEQEPIVREKCLQLLKVIVDEMHIPLDKISDDIVLFRTFTRAMTWQMALATELFLYKQMRDLQKGVKNESLL